MMAIRIIVTGRTIDKIYDPKSQGFKFKSTHIDDMLLEGRYPIKLIKLERLMLKDSLDMTNKDRLKILNACKKANEKQIIITHRTDTMAETAELLSKKIKNKTIVITGAMRPATLEESDSSFNLGGGNYCSSSP